MLIFLFFLFFQSDAILLFNANQAFAPINANEPMQAVAVERQDAFYPDAAEMFGPPPPQPMANNPASMPPPQADTIISGTDGANADANTAATTTNNTI